MKLKCVEDLESRLKMIREHNQDPTKTWKMGVNEFTDRTDQERKAYLGARPGPRLNVMQVSLEGVTSDDDVDWRDQGVITEVKDQGRCGSCWSFAAAETIESYYGISSGNLVQLSQQQILDCTPNPNHCGGSGGCRGATVELAFQQVIIMGGLASEWTYPYTSWFGENANCNQTRSRPVAKLSGYVNLPQNKQDPIKSHLSTQGPLAISIDASAFHDYDSGIFNACNQTNPDLNHAVQLVGYGNDENLGDFWLVRNSWTPNWGESGYIRLYRAQPGDELCGIDLTPGHGNGCDGGPPTIEVCGTCGILYDASYPVIAN